MTLNERRREVLLPEPVGPQIQHLTGFQGEIDVFQRRMVSLRIRELVNIYIKVRHALPARVRYHLVHHRRFRQHRTNTAAHGFSPRDFNVKHPCQRQHWPNHQT